MHCSRRHVVKHTTTTTLSYSVFLYEVQSKPVVACKIARTAFENALAESDIVRKYRYKDSTMIMQRLRDNLTLWVGEPEVK